MVGSERQRALALMVIGAVLIAFGLWAFTGALHELHQASHHNPYHEARGLLAGSVFGIAGAAMFLAGLLRYWTEPRD